MKYIIMMRLRKIDVKPKTADSVINIIFSRLGHIFSLKVSNWVGTILPLFYASDYFFQVERNFWNKKLFYPIKNR